MKVVIGSDKSGFVLKEAVKAYLKEQQYDFFEIGTTDPRSPVPFFEVAPQAAELIQAGEADKGILICGTGMGMAQVANKYRSIRAACVESVYAARMCRAINDSNMLCMGGWLIGAEMGIEMSKVFLETEFTQGLEEWRQKHLENAKKQFAALEGRIYLEEK